MPSFRVCTRHLQRKKRISAPSSLAPMTSGAERSTTNTLPELANLQSQRVSKIERPVLQHQMPSMFDQVMPLSTVEQLATYAQSKPIQ